MTGKIIRGILLLAVLAELPATAQSAFDPDWSGEASRIRERLYLWTDRDLYFSGETIRFRCDYSVEMEGSWSRVLYLELIHCSGDAVAASKYLLEGDHWEGALSIPSSTLTGGYYLRAYTRWMRNRSPGRYSHVPVRVLHPVLDETAAAGDAGVPMALEPEVFRRGQVEVEGLPSAVDGGSSVSCSLLVADGGRGDGELRACISVVPAGSLDAELGPMREPARREAEAGEGGFTLRFLPEPFGPTLSGRVTTEGIPAAFARVHFSLLGADPGYFSTGTDREGRFATRVPPRPGKQEMFVVPQPAGEGGEARVRIDTEYDNRPVSLPGCRFSLSREERALAGRMSLRMQLAEVFTADLPEPDTTPPARPIPFYGSPGTSLLLEDFVSLPTMEEVLTNLVKGVYVVRRGESPRLKIREDGGVPAPFPVLVLLDRIPLPDPESVLGLDPSRIRQIDLVDRVYVHGNQTYGGILALYSRENDLAGADLPPGGYFFDLEFPVPENAALPDVPGDESRIPDTRNTLYWDPDRTLLPDRPVPLRFRAPRDPGHYLVVVRGRGPGDRLFSALARFEVVPGSGGSPDKPQRSDAGGGFHP